MDAHFLNVEVRTFEFEAAMQRLEKGVKEGFINPVYGTLPVQARLLAERCQAITPPKNAGQGRAAVSRDITGIFTPISQTTWSNKGMRRIIRQDDRPAWNAAARHFQEKDKLRDTTAISFSPTLHDRLRNRRGFVGQGSRKNRTVTLGPEARKVRQYLATVKKRVGWARAGWNAAIVRLGGVLKGSWFATKGTAGGSIVMSLAGANPFIQVSNNTSWAGARGAEAERIVRTAIRYRARDMEKYFVRMNQLAVKKAA